MKMKGEVRGFEQAVGFLVNILHHRFQRSKWTWQYWPNAQGFTYHIHFFEQDNAEVAIFPAGWPTGSLINAAFSKSAENNWTPYRGTFSAPHIDLTNKECEVGDVKGCIFRFRVEPHPERIFSFEPVETQDIRFINRLNMFDEF